MKNTVLAFHAEFLKFKRTKVFWVTLAVVIFMSLMGGFLMFVSMHPDVARKAGLIGEKAKLMGTADWPAFFSFLSMMAVAAGAVIFGFVASWLFGREYSDKTVKDLLAQPVSRSSVVAAKFLIALLWCAILIAAEVLTGLLAGWLIGLPGWTAQVFIQGMRVMLASTVLEALLVTPIAFLASVGKGYLLPLGFVILTLIMANLVQMIGFGPYFPWAVPGLYAQSTGPSGLGAASYIIVSVTSIAGLAGTFAWWRYADQK